MKKVFTFLLLSLGLYGDVVSILPYAGSIDYGNDIQTSAKDRASIYGVHISIGDLSYLLELDYCAYDALYKDKTLSPLQQNDFTAIYSSYTPSFMLRYGVHYVQTTDTQLDDGVVAIVGWGGYDFFGYDKLSYGLDFYGSYYPHGHNETQSVTQTSQGVRLAQFSPYIQYYKALNLHWGNKVSFRYNWEYGFDFQQKQYSLYEISDTLYYDQLYVTLEYYNGEMRSGVMQGGFVVYNTLDLLKRGSKIEFGWQAKAILVAFSYMQNSYNEFSVDSSITKENTNSLYLSTINIRF